jgi:hypothetical protein
LSEVELQGDGFLLAFASVSRAFNCAIEIQRAFAAHSAEHRGQPCPNPHRHSHRRANQGCRPILRQDSHLASRIASEAQGGEIVVSSPLFN